ncbi:MAG: DUF4833 domain-containing protein [Endomicrobium sp.]|jgi:hypothetical protein|nr:DUF4833 domain-containing protein [Endomicrobium sp.]
MKSSTFFIALFAQLLCFSGLAYAQTKENLFIIERNKNANVVNYDVNIDSNGVIDKSSPVDSYWMMYAVNGQREEVSAFEKRAYGYSVSYNENGYFDLSLKAVPDRNIKILLSDGKPKAEIMINGKAAYLSKVYVFAKDGAFGIPKVQYYVLTGVDVGSGLEIQETIEVASTKQEGTK